MADNKQKQSSAEINLHANVSIQFKRSLTRKNPNGKSNYPTLQFGRITNTNYQNGKKTIATKQYRRIQP